MEMTLKPISMRSFVFSLRFSFVTSTRTLAPAGIVAPLSPVTVLATVATNRSPTLLVLVQTFSVELSASVVPAAMVPNGFSVPAGLLATVLPLGVVLLGVDVDGVDLAGA